LNRPQFFHSTPKGFSDVPFVRPVTFGQDVHATIPSGGYLNDYIVQLDNDAPQLFRSLFWQGAQQGQGPDVAGSLQVRVRDAFGNFITDGYIPIWLLFWGAGSTTPDGGSGRAKVFEPELYCEPGSTLIFDFFNSGLNATSIPAYLNPALMSPGFPAIPMETHAVGGQGQGAGVISFGGALYQVLQFSGLSFPPGVTGNVNVYKSTDGGASWTILDGANSPLKQPTSGTAIASVIYDGAGTITVAASLGDAVFGPAGPIFFQDFSLLTGFWSAAYGTVGSPNVFLLNQAYRRSDGSILVITMDSITPSGELVAHVFKAGAWIASFDLTTGILPAGWTAINMSSTVLDPATDTIHMFGIALNGILKKQFYEQILSTNSVAGFQDLTGVYGAASAMGDPVLYGGKLCWGVMDPTLSFATILVGSPLAAPVFSIAGYPGVFPGQPNPAPFPSTLQPTLATDGTTLWAVWLSDGTADIVNLSFTQNTSNPLTGWTGASIFDDPTGTILNGIRYPSMVIGPNGAPIITVEGHEGAGPAHPTNFYFGPIGAPGGAALYPGLFELRGVKRLREGCV
jgi:hypothetical protein